MLRGAVVTNDTRSDSRFQPDESSSETRSELVVPLSVGGEIVGTLDVNSTERDAFSSEDTVVIERLGDQIAIAIQNARLYQHSRELAVLEERNRLARELHDSVTQSLYSIALFAQAGAKLAKSGNAEQMTRQFADVGETAQQALREMRLQLYELRPLALAEEGLILALQRRLDTVERQSGITASLDAPQELALAAPMEDALYRIAQEALNNVLKHSEASSVRVLLQLAGDRVQMSISDNGKGFEPNQAGRTGGMGLATMRERAQALGGSVAIHTAPGSGTTIVVSVSKDGAFRPARG
jgi:signal transduction histidine kinase